MKLSSKGTKMAKFEQVNFLRASLLPEEVHLHSFKGFLCKWHQGRLSSKETPILIEDAALLGHVTDTRLIIETGNVDTLSMVLGALGPKFLERLVPRMNLSRDLFDMQQGKRETMHHLADQIGYVSFDFANMDHLGVYEVAACWPVMKYNMNGRDPVFLPYNLYSITQYTGAIVGPPAPGEFAEVIRDRGVRIVTYTSEVS